MPQEAISGIALVAAIFAGRMYYKHIIKNGSKEQRFIAKAKKRGCVTTGTCVDVERFAPTNRSGDTVRDRNYKVWVKYAYKVNGVVYHTSMCFMDEGSMFPDYPRSVQVYYDAGNPKKAVCPEEATKLAQNRTGCMGSLVIGLVIYAVGVHILKFLLG